jgi:hypothetical protein
LVEEREDPEKTTNVYNMLLMSMKTKINSIQAHCVGILYSVATDNIALTSVINHFVLNSGNTKSNDLVLY